MTVLLPALLAGSAVAAAAGLPGQGALRLRAVVARPPTAVPRSGAALLRVPVGGGRRSRAVPAMGAMGVVFGFALLLGPGLALLGAAAAVAASQARRARLASAATLSERTGAVEACGALAAELRAGRPPAGALAVAAELGGGPAQQALRAAAAAAHWGGDVPGALVGTAGAGSAVPEVLRGLAACWQVCGQSGGGLAAAVERLADGLRARQAQQRAVAAALAGPRASAGLLAVLPLGGTALAAGLGAHPLHVLLHTPLGLACLAAGLGLDLAGLRWSSRIVARAAGAGR